jgi:flagellar biosynthesis chaperone FliJ
MNKLEALNNALEMLVDSQQKYMQIIGDKDSSSTRVTLAKYLDQNQEFIQQILEEIYTIENDYSDVTGEGQESIRIKTKVLQNEN